MRRNFKHFIIGALLASVPMSYGVNNSMPSKVTEVKESVQNTFRPEEFLWSPKLISSNKSESQFRTGSKPVLAWTYTFGSVSKKPLEEIPNTKVTPMPVPKSQPRVPKDKPQTQTAVYVVHSQVAPQDVSQLIERYASEYGVNKEMMIHIAKCESGFRNTAVNGPYAGIYQFVASTWASNRRAMGLDTNPNLRYNTEEAIRTAAFKMARDGFGAWPVCQNKARKLLGLNQ